MRTTDTPELDGFGEEAGTKGRAGVFKSVRRRAAHRARRLDLVHRRGELVLPRCLGVAARPADRGSRLRRGAGGSGGQALVVDPCIPKRWPGFSATYRHGGTTYSVRVENPRGVNRGVERVTLDGEELPDLAVPLVDDGAEHEVVVTMLGG